MVAERGHAPEPSAEKAVGSRRGRWRTMTSVEQKENVKGNEQPATYATEHVVKVGTELRGVRDGIFAPMDTNLNPATSTGELKVFYCKVGDYNRFLAEAGADESGGTEDCGRSTGAVYCRNRW